MSDGNTARGLRERLTSGTEDRLGKALTDLFENPLLNGALGRASDAREKAIQAQELAMGALNLPSSADIERLTRRLRSVSQRLEGIEDGVDRLGRALSGQSIEARLAAVEAQLGKLSRTLGDRSAPSGRGTSSSDREPAAKSKPAPKSKPTKSKPRRAPARSGQAGPAGRAAPKQRSAGRQKP
jgi:hypothetical protein